MRVSYVLALSRVSLHRMTECLWGIGLIFVAQNLSLIVHCNGVLSIQ